jgi:glutamate formiminotransferase/formiminotetrahydrofolate cyclodeaminase
MRKIVECVPNISEGRDRSVIDEVASAALVAGVKILHLDIGRDAHRTVITLAGEPEAMVEAMFRLVRKTVEKIDLRKHVGTHPRIGATDVCPFVPIQNVSMEECVKLSRALGHRVAAELSLPVYYYEEAATSPDRKNLPYLRQGGFEALPSRMKRPELRPDEGPADPHPSAGALITGARTILIAYNVRLATRSVEIARAIASTLRESGGVVQDESGPRRAPGKLPLVRAIGWFMEEFDAAEVSYNLLDYRVTGLYEVFEATSKEAARHGVSVTGSEIIGLVPQAALVEAGRRVEASVGGPDEGRLIDLAVAHLRLAASGPFNPKEKILEERLLHEASGLPTAS